MTAITGKLGDHELNVRKAAVNVIGQWAAHGQFDCQIIQRISYLNFKQRISRLNS
jgi:hypothetical protein